MQLKTILALVLITCLVASLAAAPAFALPPPPSSFHGTIKADGQNVEEGTFVIALINGDAYASTFIEIDQGNSVYSLEVPGDDPDTREIEGGREGDTVQFEFVGVLADQTGTWQSDTDVLLNLTVSGFGAPDTPTPTPTPRPTPTLTPGPTAQVSPTPTRTPTPTAQPSMTPTQTSFGPPSPTNTALPTPTLTPTPSRQPPQAGTPLPTPTLTPTPSRQPPQAGTPLPTLTSSPMPTLASSPGQQPPLVSTLSPAPTQTLVSPRQPAATTMSSPTPVATHAASPGPTRTLVPNRQPLPTRSLPSHSEQGDLYSTRLTGLLLIVAAVGVVWITAVVIAVYTVMGGIRPTK